MTDGPDKLPLEFKQRLETAKALVSAARASGDKLALANALKELGNIQRRPPLMWDAANETFAEAVELYLKLEMPLAAAWVTRHIGINHEYAEHLTEAEKYYDESLGLFREHASDNDDNYANTVRYPAVIKNRVGKRDESTILWEEAVRRYEKMDQPLGVAEGAAWLTIFAIEEGDLSLAHEWFAKAEAAASAANDPDTDKFIAEVRAGWPTMSLKSKRSVVRTRHVLAVKDLKVEADYYLDKLGFERDFTAPGWEFLSFGDFKVMLGECSDEITAEESGNHSWFAHVVIKNVDEVYAEFIERGAKILSRIENKPWGIREFSVVTPDGHRIVFGQMLG